MSTHVSSFVAPLSMMLIFGVVGANLIKVENKRYADLDTEKIKLTKAYNTFSLPDKMVLMKDGIVRIDCKDARGDDAPMYPAPTSPDQITTALATPACGLVLNGPEWK